MFKHTYLLILSIFRAVKSLSIFEPILLYWNIHLTDGVGANPGSTRLHARVIF